MLSCQAAEALKATGDPGSTTQLEFVSDDEGRVLHMVMFQDGAEKVSMKVD